MSVIILIPHIGPTVMQKHERCRVCTKHGRMAIKKKKKKKTGTAAKVFGNS